MIGWRKHKYGGAISCRLDDETVEKISMAESMDVEPTGTLKPESGPTFGALAGRFALHMRLQRCFLMFR